MKPEIAALLRDAVVMAALRRAWLDSNPGPDGGHEEGGYILRDGSGTIIDSRWPKGSADVIHVPPHQACRFRGFEIVASYHTYPNTSPEYEPQPSNQDVLMIACDSNLRAAWFVGEFVVSAVSVYLVEPSGAWSTGGRTDQLFSPVEEGMTNGDGS
jgi:hypothetical protein